jgi:hypothetical protein
MVAMTGIHSYEGEQFCVKQQGHTASCFRVGMPDLHFHCFYTNFGRSNIMYVDRYRTFPGDYLTYPIIRNR